MAMSVTMAGCERGCARGWLRERGMGGAPAPSVSRSFPVNAMDCPDGLARCVEGRIEVSRLAVIAQPCRGPESACACPWEPLAWCGRGCVAPGVELIIERDAAAAQLCAPAVAASASRVSPRPSDQREGHAGDGGGAWDGGPGSDGGQPRSGWQEWGGRNGCDEGQLYRCQDGRVVDCTGRAVVAECPQGCFAEGAFIADDVSREGAFAILCSR
jgi:hypothetical protein